MNIAISQRNDPNKWGRMVDSLESDYVEYFEKYGITLIIIPNSTKNLKKYFEGFNISGVVLSGGNTINPTLYNEPCGGGDAISDKRDNVEKRLLEIAIEKRLPVLGICRGMQFLNVFFGGRLEEVKNLTEEKHVNSEHLIKISDEKAREISIENASINSFHDQCITEKSLAIKLKSFATSNGGIIEGIYHPDLPIAGIQWHPERNSFEREINKKVIDAFLNRNIFWGDKMKGIILAGGLGTRLGKYTENLPKCMLNFNGKTLIERQVENFKKCGINDIIVIRKHLAEKIQIPGVRYVDETDYDTHMVVGLFEARKEFDSDIIMAYGDVLFEPRVLKKLIDAKGDVCIVGDEDWKEYWTARLGSFTKDSESFIIGENDKMVSLGVEDPPIEDMDARYVGMIKFSKSALPKIEKVYDDAAKESWEKPWHTSKSFKKAYMTDFMQELIDKGLDVRAVRIKRGWLEFDTVDDYELTVKWQKEGSLGRFIELENGS